MASTKTWIVAEPYLNIHCSLGEGPYYEAETHSLRFVDIKKQTLHTVDLSQGPESLQTLQFDMPVGVTADIEGIDPSKKILLAGKDGVYVLDRAAEKWELLKRFRGAGEIEQRLRSNDGAVDPKGRFWIGTMNDFWVGEPQAEGSLYRIESDLVITSMRSSLKIPNGIGWSLDQKTQYFTHSTEKRILAFDYVAETGSITNERVFWQHDGDGDPDGFKMDLEGYIWQAIYGEGRVLRISPEGKVVGEIKYPTRNITCPVFVGTELWVTSADEEDERETESKRFGGGVFRVDVGVRGVKDFKFKLDSRVGA